MKKLPPLLLVGIILALIVAATAGIFALLDTASTPELTDYEPRYIDGSAMLNLTETLSSDALEGRATGTAGNAAARGFILKRFEKLGLRPLGDGYEHDFPAQPNEENPDVVPSKGVNIVGWVAGETPGEGPMLVVTAHYDHLGIVDGEIYNGADDNASGTAALIAIAEYLERNPPVHDVVFAALDAEEIDLQGAADLIMSGVLDLDRIALNINFDMVSRSEEGELYVAGTYHYPELLPLIEQVSTQAPVKLLIGHDTPDLGYFDWTDASDHAQFHEAGIPFLYFGVEDHDGYHQPSDDYVNITHDFFLRAGDTLAMAVIAVDASMGEIYEDSR